MKNINLQLRYALAVSGGVDSMVMLHKFASLCPRPNFFVVTVNHGIRTEAENDCKFVADYCKQLGVECLTYNIDVPTYCKQHGVSTETGARLLRYQVFDSLDCDYVCLAHHGDDNVETILMHILRGSGARGATGIRHVNGKYFRPLLDISREQIEQYAKDNNVPYVKDITNDDVRYTRNFVRHKVLPLLGELNVSAKQNILRFANNISRDDEYLESLADIDSVIFLPHTAKIPINLLLQPTPIAYRVIYKVFANLGVYYDIETTHLDAIVRLASNVGGKRVDLPFGYVAVNDYEYVTICQTIVTDVEQFEIPFAVGRTITPLGVVEVSKEQLPGSLRIDVDKVPVSAVFRIRRQGDVFTKFGGGTKPLKKYLIDKKIPERNRDSLLLVADGNNILVICGVEIADSLKVDGGAMSYYIRLFIKD